MFNFRDKNVTIGEVVTELPQASQIFTEYKIDFCCGGHRKLYDVIIQQGIDHQAVYEALEAEQQARLDRYRDNDFTKMSPSVLTDYIEDTHHSYLREILPQLSELLGTIVRVHGRNHTELFEVYRLYGTLKTDLEQHLLKEETMLFPAFSDIKDNQEEIGKLSAMIIGEHEAAGEILGALRTVTDNYKLPEDACGTFEKTYTMFQELEKDLHQHIHLENNILLKEFDVRMKS